MIPSPSTEWSWNVTNQSYPQGMVVANTISGGALMFLVIIILGVVALMVLLTSLEWFTKFFDSLEWLIKSIKYTLFGAGIVVLLYAIYIVCTILVMFGSGINPIHIGLGILAYVGVTVLGLGATKVYDRFREYADRYEGKE